MSARLPALPPPPGQEPFSAHPESLARWNTICVSICLSITTILFVLRCHVRIFIKRSWILEDYLVFISWAGLVTFCALVTTNIRHHGGVHGWDLTVEQVHQVTYWFNVASIEYAPVILDTKVAILLLYRRVFLPHRGGIFDWMLRVFIGVLVGFYLATTLVKIWECNPREKIWNTSIPGRCVNVSSLLNTSGLFNSITDVMILLVPVKFVWNLQLSRRQKVGVVAVFTIGFCGPAFSIIGFVVRLRISSSADVAYNYPEILLWAAAEITTGLICVCIPELAAFGRYRHSSRPRQSILNGAAVTRRSHPYSTMKRNSLDGQALCDGIRLEEGRSITSNIKREIPALPMGVVVVDIEGGVSLPQERSGEKDVLGEGKAHSGGEDAGPKLGIMTSVRLEQTIA